MSESEKLPMPETVKFVSERSLCVAFVLNEVYGLNMRSCQINLEGKPQVNIEYLPDRTRVLINGGNIWFDTDEQSATEIEALFLTGEAPAKIG